MIDFDRETGFAADAHGFLHAFDQLIALAAHVGGVLALVFRGDFAQFDQFFGLGEKGGRID